MWVKRSITPYPSRLSRPLSSIGKVDTVQLTSNCEEVLKAKIAITLSCFLDYLAVYQG